MCTNGPSPVWYQAIDRTNVECLHCSPISRTEKVSTCSGNSLNDREHDKQQNDNNANSSSNDDDDDDGDNGDDDDFSLLPFQWRPIITVPVSTSDATQPGNQDPASISEKTSFCKISLSLEAAGFVFKIVRSLWNLTGTSAAVLPMCLSNFKAMRQFKNTNLVASRLYEILRKDVFSDIETGPRPHRCMDGVTKRLILSIVL